MSRAGEKKKTGLLFEGDGAFIVLHYMRGGAEPGGSFHAWEPSDPWGEKEVFLCVGAGNLFRVSSIKWGYRLGCGAQLST